MMSPRPVWQIGFLSLILIGSISQLFGQDTADTEIEFLEIRTEREGSSIFLEFILTADQYVDRIAMENSHDLVTWQVSEVAPNWNFDVEGQASFLSAPLGGAVFYRAGIVLPNITLLQDTVQAANGQESPAVSFGFSDPGFPFEFPELEIVSSNTALIPQDNIELIRSTFISTVQVTPTFEGVGDVSIDLIVKGPDGVEAKATLVVTVVEGGGFSPSIEDFYNAVLERKYPSLNYIFSTVSPSTRFSRNGEPGDWFYQLDAEDPAKALIGFTYDETNHDPNVYTEIVRLSYLTDVSGNYELVEVTNGVDEVVSSGAFDLRDFPLFGAGAAPTEAAFARMAVGKSIGNSAWTLDTATRFNYTEPSGSPERGNWKYVKTGEKTGRVTLTYDEDNNNPAVYREEMDLVFETLESGSLTYREYFGTELNDTYGDVFDYSD